jgi:hypothetical protein
VWLRAVVVGFCVGLGGGVGGGVGCAHVWGHVEYLRVWPGGV